MIWIRRSRGASRLKADRAAWWGSWGLEEGLQLLPEDLQTAVVLEECFVDLSKSLEHFGIGHELLTHLDEGTDDEDAHGSSRGAVQDGGSHDGSVLGEGPGEVAGITMLLGTGHNL